MSHFIIWTVIIGAIYLYFSRFIKSKKPTQYRYVNYSNLDRASVYFWEVDDKVEMDFEVVGESFYQSYISKIVELPNLMAYLIPEDNNPYDNKAVRVDIEEQTVGYLSKQDAIAFRRKLKSKKLLTDITCCKAFVTGGHIKGGNNMSYGIELDFYK